VLASRVLTKDTPLVPNRLPQATISVAVMVSPETAGTDWERRTVEILSDGCFTEPIAVERISIVNTKGAAPSAKRPPLSGHSS